MQSKVETAVPGRAPIELISFYEEFLDYYPLCELETKRWFVENVQPDWWIFDIGANVGYYSVLFAQLASNGRVHAFEPTSTAAMLRKNLLHNNVPNVDVHEIALGAVTGVHQDRIFRMWGTDGDVQEYPFYRLDDFVEERKPERIDCIKIDVDSFDFEVLRGAENVLRKWNPFIVVELNHALAKRNQSAGEALAWLARRGYRRARVLDHDNFVLRRTDAAAPAVVQGEATLELVFPPPMRFDESLEFIKGSRIDKPLVRVGRLQNGATMQAATEPHTASAGGAGRGATSLTGALANRLAFARKLFPRKDAEPTPASDEFAPSAILGNAIETAPAIWSYALMMEFDPETLGSLPRQDSLSFEVAVEVVEGKLGIVLAGRDPSTFCSPERTLAEMTGIQRIVVSAPVEAVQHMVFRNVALEGTRTLFRVMSVAAKSTPAS